MKRDALAIAEQNAEINYGFILPPTDRNNKTYKHKNRQTQFISSVGLPALPQARVSIRWSFFHPLG